MKKFKTLQLIFLMTFVSIMASAKHYTVVISLDGCRWDYTEWYNTPFFDTMAKEGVSSGLIPSYPSKTFPNHYTIATGLYPDNHGIIANEFFDPKTGLLFSLGDAKTKTDPQFYGGEPIWNTAYRQGKRVSVFYWPGSDVKVNGRYPDSFFYYDKQPRLTFSQRIEGIVHAMSLPENKRPDLVMAYFEQPDASGHDFGPQSKHTRKAVEQVDSLMESLYSKLCQLPYSADINFIVLSDHGMAWVPQGNNIPISKYLKPEWIRKISGSIPCNIYAQKGCEQKVYDALKNLDHVQVWHRRDIPHYLHFGSNERVGDIVVNPEIGYMVTDVPTRACGSHGFDPELLEMHAIFRAIGPDFRHSSIPHFRNVNIYSLLCRLLKIEPATNDGDINEIKAILKE